MEKFAIGVDLGGTTIKFASVSESGKIILDYKLPTEAENGPVRVIENIMQGISYLLSLNSVKMNEDNLVGIGVGVPGVVSLDGGTVSYPPNLAHWEVVRLGDILQQKMKETLNLTKPVYVENDANVAALGEAKFGAAKSFEHFIMITLGTGVGGGIIINRKIYRGATGAAGELGHISIDFNSEVIHAGIRGSIEGLIGHRQITEHAKMLLKKTPSRILSELCKDDFSILEPKILTEAAHRGDRVSRETWQFVGDVLGAGLGTMVSILDIRKFVIGGGVAGAGNLIFKPAMSQLLRFTLQSMQADLEIVPAELGNSAGVMGASALCL